MSSSNSSDAASEASEQWDDMAIVRAFEDALSDQRQRAGGAAAKRQAKKNKSARNGRKPVRRVSVVSEGDEDEDEDEDAGSSSRTPAAAAAVPSPAYSYAGAAATTHSMYYQPSYATQSQPQPQANGCAMPPTPMMSAEHAPQGDVYQLAYAHAYATLQAQFQAAASQAPAPQYPPGYGYTPHHASAYSPFAPAPPPHAPPHAAPPFPSVASVHAAASGGKNNEGDDGLSNLLLAWYQSGYYTGRFQAMQELRARQHR